MRTFLNHSIVAIPICLKNIALNIHSTVSSKWMRLSILYVFQMQPFNLSKYFICQTVKLHYWNGLVGVCRDLKSSRISRINPVDKIYTFIWWTMLTNNIKFLTNLVVGRADRCVTPFEIFLCHKICHPVEEIEKSKRCWKYDSSSSVNEWYAVYMSNVAIALGS